MTSSRFILYSLLAIMSALMLSSLFNDTALGIPNRYFAPHRPPISNPGTNQTVNTGQFVTLDGSKSKAPDGTITSYLWKQIGGPNVTLNGPSMSIATFTAPKNISSDTDMIFKLTVIDNKNASNTADVKVTDKYVPPPHRPPISNPGTNQTVNTGQFVTLDGSKSKAPDGTITSYLWKQIGGPNVTLNGPSMSKATFTAPKNISSDTDMIFKLTVIDNKNASNTADVKVTDKYVPPPHRPPISNPGTNQTVNTGQFVTLDGSKSKAPDGTITSYLWKQIGGPNVTLNGPSMSKATFTAPKNISSDTDMIFKLTVIDNKNASNTADVKVTDKYVPPPHRPPISNPGTNQTVNTGQFVTLDGSKSKAPDGTITSYLWKQIGGPNVTLNGPSMSKATFTAPKNISSDTDMIFKLTVIDNKNASNTADVKVTDKYVPPPHRPPISNPGTNQTVNTGQFVTLDGSKSKAPDGTITSYLWKQIGGPNVTLNGPSMSKATFTAPKNISSDTDMIFKLTVIDNKNASNTADVKVTDKYVPPPHRPPISNPGTNQTVNTGY